MLPRVSQGAPTSLSAPKTNAHESREPREEPRDLATSPTKQAAVSIGNNDYSGDHLDATTTQDLSIEQASVNPDLQNPLSELHSFLSGESVDEPFIDFKDEVVRRAVAAELVNFAAIETDDASSLTGSSDDDELMRSQRNRARQLFVDHGYLDDVLKQLSSSAPPEQRAEAARTLGIIRSQRATALLIAALFDEEASVRDAATNSLAQIGDPSVTIDHASIDDQGDSAGEINTQIQETESTEVTEPSATRVELLYPLTLGDVSRQSPAEVESADPTERYEQALRQIEELETQLLAAVSSRNQAEKEVLLRLDQESRFRAEAAARRHEDEEARKRAEEKAARRRYEDERKLATEQLARVRVEEELQEFAASEDRLRLELSGARQRAKSLADLRVEADIAEQKSSREEIERTRNSLLEQYAADMDALRKEEESLRIAVEQTASKRNEIEMARQGIELQNQRLAEETARLATLQSAYREEYESIVVSENSLRANQETLTQRAQELEKQFELISSRRSEIEAMNEKFESERAAVEAALARVATLEEEHREVHAQCVQLETELQRKTQEEERLLADLRLQSDEQEERLRVARTQRNDEYEARLRDLDVLKRQLNEEASRRADEESLISEEVEALRLTEAAMRKRIEDAESRRNAAEETKRVLADQIQRIEADAHTRSLESEVLEAKLEQVRRNVEMESRTRAEKVEKLKREIENLRASEEEHRNRFEEESRRRVEIEARLQQEKEKLGMAERVRVKTEVLLETLPQSEIKTEADKNGLPVSAAETQAAPDDVSTNVNEKKTALAARETPDLDRAAALPENIVAGLNSAHPHKRASALSQLPALSTDRAISFNLIVEYFDDPSPDVRNAAAKALRDLEPLRPAESFTRALEDAPANRERNIGKALAASGIADEAINNLDSENREETYNALCLLFVMAKAGEVKPLVEAIENHQDVEVRRAAIKLLNLSGQSDLADAAAKRRLGLSASAHSNS